MQHVDTPDSTLTSVVMVSYRTGPVLFHAIKAVLTQAVNLELILVDNGNPPEVTKTLSDLAGPRDAFRVFTGQGNIGFAAACNLGARHARGEILLFLNPDCIVASDTLQVMLEELARLPQRSLLGSDIRNPDLSGQSGARRHLLTPWLALVEMTKLYRLAPRHPYFTRFKQHQDPLPEETVDVPAISGAFMAIRREHYFDIAGMDEDFFFHVEDLDFCLRFHLSGGQIFFSPNLRTIHMKGSSQVSWFYVEWYKALGLCRYFRKHFEDVYPAGFIGFLICGLFVRLLLRSVVQGALSSARAVFSYRGAPRSGFSTLEAER